MSHPTKLTPREIETLRYMALGYTYNQIAHKMSIAYATARKHTYNVTDKMGIHQVHAPIVALALGIITLDEAKHHLPEYTRQLLSKTN